SRGASLRSGVAGRALAGDPAALSLGAVPRAPGERWHGGDGRLAPVRPPALPHLVGLRDDRGPARAGNPLPARAGYHTRHERRVAIRPGGRGSDGDHRARVARPRVAADRPARGGPRHRPRVHPRHRRAHPGGDQAIRGRPRVSDRGRRVVITGVGAVTPIGTAADGLWAGLVARRSAVRAVTRFDPTPFRSRIAAEIPDFRPQDHLDAKRAKRLDRFSQLAVTSARFALADAELAPAREDPDRIGAMMGSALGGVAFAEAQVGGFLKQGPRGLDPALALAVFAGAASCNIAIEFGFTGPNSTNAMSCASGTIAVGDAFQAIREDRADVMFAGGAEAPLAPMTYAAFSVIRAMSTRNDDPEHASRPFDEARDGFVMGE